MAFADDVNRILRDHQGYSGDGQGGHGTLPVGDRSTARKPISKRDLRELLVQMAQTMGDPSALQTIIDQLDGKADVAALQGLANKQVADDQAVNARVTAETTAREAAERVGDILWLTTSGDGDNIIAATHPDQAHIPVGAGRMIGFSMPATNEEDAPTITIDGGESIRLARRTDGAPFPAGALLYNSIYIGRITGAAGSRSLVSIDSKLMADIFGLSDAMAGKADVAALQELADEINERIDGDAGLQTQIDAKADLRHSGSFFNSREDAVALGQESLPDSISNVVTREGDFIVFRAPGLIGDDPLFDEFPQWGVRHRLPSETLVATMLVGKADKNEVDQQISDESEARKEGDRNSAKFGYEFFAGLDRNLSPLMVSEDGKMLLGVDGQGLFAQNVGYEFYSFDTAELPEFVILDRNGAVISGGIGGGEDPDAKPPPGFQEQFDFFVDNVSGQFAAINSEINNKAEREEVDALSDAVSAIDQAQQLGYPLVTSESEGLAAVFDGEYFAVVGSTDFQTLYRREGASAIEVSAIPSLNNLPETTVYLPENRPWRKFDSVRISRVYDPAYSQNPNSVIPTYGAIYALFDALVNEHPGYVTRELIGRDSLDNPIYEYITQPEVPRLSTEWVPMTDRLSAPKIVLLGGTHGQEKGQHYANYVFLRDLCKHWRETPELESLRFGCQIVFVPALNPSGINAHERKNHNGVDLNRNQPTEWGLAGSDDPTARDYYGPSPQSEAESVIAANLTVRHSDAILMIDHHGASAPSASGGAALWIGAWQPDVVGYCLEVMRKVEVFTRREYPEFDVHPNTSLNRLTRNHSGSISLHWQSLGGRGILLETPGVLGFTDGRFGQAKFVQFILQNTLNLAYQVEMRKRQNNINHGEDQ